MRADRFSLTSMLAEVRNQFAIIADVGFLDAVAHADRTDALIAKLREITLAYKAEGSREERLALIETLRWHSECDSNALHAARERFGSGSRPSNRSQLRRKGTDPLAGSTPRCGSHVHHPVRPRATDESQICGL